MLLPCEVWQAVVADANGGKISEVRYYPWGTRRYASGSIPTLFQFTSESMQISRKMRWTGLQAGQRIEGNFGLYDYGARWSQGRAPGTLRSWSSFSAKQVAPMVSPGSRVVGRTFETILSPFSHGIFAIRVFIFIPTGRSYGLVRDCWYKRDPLRLTFNGYVMAYLLSR